MQDPTKIITPPQWMRDPALIKCMDVLNLGDVNAYLVGGCVRNWVMNCGVSDIDIATRLLPDAVMARFDNAGFKVIPTGIDHGTVTAVIDGTPFEITTFRKDINTDGRHADVAFTDDMAHDAARRDFTINALYADMDGRIFDPTGQGMDDCADGIVRFIGNARDRIHEDVLRILRFFRFYGAYGNGAPDDDALQACQECADMITGLSRERVTQEFSKIVVLDTAHDVLALMQGCGVLDVVLGDVDIMAFKKLNDIIHSPNWAMRVFILLGCDRTRFEAAKNRFVFPNKDKKHIKTVCRVLDDLQAHASFPRRRESIAIHCTMDSRLRGNDGGGLDQQQTKIAAYYHGKHTVYDALASLYVDGRINKAQAQSLLTIIQNWAIPTFPTTGHDLIAQGYEKSPALGARLKELEREWLLAGI